jgi:hypothetical protein
METPVKTISAPMPLVVIKAIMAYMLKIFDTWQVGQHGSSWS